MLGWLFGRRERKEERRVEEKPAAEGMQPQEPVVILGVDGSGMGRGLYKKERMHITVHGFPGTGKSTLLLNLILQNIRDGEGFLLLDPHGDLVKKVMTHIPESMWDRVVYINPLTAYDKRFRSVVQINFLQYEKALDRDLVARTIMDALQKIYQRFWGPRLDMIMLNAIYLLLEGSAPRQPKFPKLYDVLSSEEFREMLLGKCTDEKVIAFWEKEFKRMPRDASAAVMTKIYRIVQEKVIAPMFDCERSSLSFRRAMDQGLFVLVNLSEGAITSDLANFLGSLILAQVYLAAMSREDTPEKDRRPFYVYIDEAYRFTTRSIQDILQSLRKYKVYMTLVSQFIGQYDRETAQAIPSLCDTIICFSVGKETAKALEEFYAPGLTYKDLMFMPRYHFAVSTPVGDERLWQVLKCIDHKYGKTRLYDVVKHSLFRYGRPVEVDYYVESAEKLGELSLPPIYPTEYVILSALWKARQEKSGRGPNREWVEYAELFNADVFNMRHDFDGADFLKAMNLLVRRGYIAEHDEETRWKGIRVKFEPPFISQPAKCIKCGKLTNRPFRLKATRNPLCRTCVENSLGKKEFSWQDIDGLNPDDIGEEFYARRTLKYYYLRPSAINTFFLDVPRGPRGGGTRHTAMLSYMLNRLRMEGNYCIPDLGTDAPRKVGDEYVAKRKPDITVYPLLRDEGKTHPWRWNTPCRYAVEIETDPLDHKEHVINNWKKCRAFGVPVIFVVDDEEAAFKTAKILRDAGARIVSSIEKERGPGYIQVLYLDPETGTQFTVHPEMLDMEEVIIPGKEGEEKEEESEERRSDKTLIVLQPLKAEALEAFRDWKLKARKAKPGWILLAEKKVKGNTVTVQLGGIDEKEKEAISKMGLEVEGLEMEEEIQGRVKHKKDRTKLREKKEELDTRKVSNREVRHKKIRHRGEIEKKILAYSDWTLYVTTINNRQYIYARKYDRENKKTIRRSLGFLSEEARKIIKKHRLEVRGMTD
jgi:hypothetical protein